MLPDGKLTPYAALFPAHWARRWGSPWLRPKLKTASAVIRSPRNFPLPAIPQPPDWTPAAFLVVLLMPPVSSVLWQRHRKSGRHPREWRSSCPELASAAPPRRRTSDPVPVRNKRAESFPPLQEWCRYPETGHRPNRQPSCDSGSAVASTLLASVSDDRIYPHPIH